MSIKKELFGLTPAGEPVYLYTLTNENGMSARLSSYGAVLQSLFVPDRKGRLQDVVLGYGELKPYLVNSPGFGAVIGRNANRIRNAAFSLNGAVYQLAKNDGKNNLHSGPEGFQHGVWKAEEKRQKGASLCFTYRSPSMEQGFPGELVVSVTYELTRDNRLCLSYEAVSDADTVVNLTNHSYFNLAGHGSGSVLGQRVRLNAARFTPTDPGLIPTGELRRVAGTPMDFTESKAIGRDIHSNYEPLWPAGGYDHNWVLDKGAREFGSAARMEDEGTGRWMEVYTDLPGLQFYTANFLDGTEEGKEAVFYQKNAGACFETQFFPDAVNQPSFPSPVLKAGEVFHSRTEYRFGITE